MAPKKASKKKASKRAKLPAYDEDVGLEGWLRQVLGQAAKDFDREEDEHIFLLNPESSLANYRSRISHPMYLELIAERCRNVYTSITELEWDVRLMCNNCRAFNAAGSKWVGYADSLQIEATGSFPAMRAAFAKLEESHPEEAKVLQVGAAERLAAHPLYGQLGPVGGGEVEVGGGGGGGGSADGKAEREDVSPAREDRASLPPVVHPALRSQLLAEAQSPMHSVPRRVLSVDAALAMYQSTLHKYVFSKKNCTKKKKKFLIAA